MCGAAYPSDKPCEDLRLAIEDLRQTFPDRYTRADEFLKRLDAVEKRMAAGGADAAAASADLSKLQHLIAKYIWWPCRILNHFYGADNAVALCHEGFIQQAARA